MILRRWLLAALAGLALSAGAEEARARKVATAAQAADAVLAAVADGRMEAVRRLAAREQPDPWGVAAELARRGAPKAAAAFARAAPRPDVAGLPAAVGRWQQAAAPVRTAWFNGLLEAEAHLGAGRLEAALAAASALAEAPDPYVRARCFFVRYQVLAKRRDARGTVEAAVACARESLTAGWLRRAAAAREMAASVATATGDFAAALAHHQAELAIHRRRRLPLLAARAQANIGFVHVRAGDFAQAIDALRAAETQLRRLGAHAMAAQVLDTLGTAQMNLGRYADALRTHEQALAIFERARKAASDLDDARFAARGVATSLGQLGNVHERLGAYRQAREMHERALALLSEQDSAARYADTVGNLGTAHLRMEAYAEAAGRYKEALDIYTRLGDERSIARAHSNLGWTRLLQGEVESAERHLSLALERFEGLKDWYGIATVQANLGDVHARDPKRHKQAVAAYQAAVTHASEWGLSAVELEARLRLARILRLQGDDRGVLAQARAGLQLTRRIVVGLGTRHGALARSTTASLCAEGALAAQRLGAHEDAFFLLESGRAGALLNSLEAQQAIRDFGLPDELRKAERAARDRTAAAGIRLLEARTRRDLRRSRALRKELLAAQQALDGIIGRIEREQMAAANLLYPTVDPPSRVQSRLTPRDALVLYGAFADEVVAVVATRGKVRSVHLGPTTRIAALCDGIEPNFPGAYAPEVQGKLVDLLVKPLRIPKDVERIFVSPSGCLFQLPFGLLLGSRTVVQVPSATTHRVLADHAADPGEKVLALGGVDYSRYERLDDLPGSTSEAQAIGDLVLIGPGATEGGLIQGLATRSRWATVHLACHGVFRSTGAFHSYLALTPGTEAAAGDGRLTGLEVLRTRVPADLVVLSACETGRGTVVPGEGLLGLMRAFLIAGARGVLVSLWNADNDAAVAFMRAFYTERSKKGVSVAEALERAQASVRAEEHWKDPYYWANWVLWGAP